MLLGSVCSKLCSLLEIRRLFGMAFLQTHDWGPEQLEACCTGDFITQKVRNKHGSPADL